MYTHIYTYIRTDLLKAGIDPVEKPLGRRQRRGHAQIVVHQPQRERRVPSCVVAGAAGAALVVTPVLRPCFCCSLLPILIPLLCIIIVISVSVQEPRLHRAKVEVAERGRQDAALGDAADLLILVWFYCFCASKVSLA